MQRVHEPAEAGGVRVLPGQRAGEPGQFGPELVGPDGFERATEGVQRAADPAGRVAQRAGGLVGALRAGVRGRAVLALQPEAP